MLLVGCILALLGAAMVGFGGITLYKRGFSTVWNVRLKNPKWYLLCKILSPVAIAAGIFLIIQGFRIPLSGGQNFAWGQILWPAAMLLIGLALSAFITAIVLHQKLIGSDNAQPLGTLTIMEAVDAEIATCKRFHLHSQGISFYNEDKLCYRTIHFRDHQLDDLNKLRELWCVHIYLRQKYESLFRCKAQNVSEDGEKAEKAAGYLYIRKK